MFFRPSLFPKTPRRISQTADTVTESRYIPHNNYQTLDSCQSLRDTQRHFKSLPLNSARSLELIYLRRLPNLWLYQNRPTLKYIKHRISNISTTIITNKTIQLHTQYYPVGELHYYDNVQCTTLIIIHLFRYLGCT